MANALQWIIKEAKHLRRKYPKRFKTWKEYVAQASAVYASKHKGRSPVGRKRKVSSIGKGGTPRPTRPAPVNIRYGRKGSLLSGIRTTSKSHTDKNRITANIQVGAVTSGVLKAELKKRLTEKINYLVLRKYHSHKKRDKTKLQKQITHIKAELRKLS